MMTTKLSRVAVGVVASAVACLIVQSKTFAARVAIPYADGFETNAVGAVANTIWTINNGSSSVQTSQKFEGSKACYMTNYGDNYMEMALNIETNGVSYTNIWCRLFTKVIPYEDNGGLYPPTVTNGAVAALYVSTTGVVRAYAKLGATNGWTSLTTVSTNIWLGFAVHVDYMKTNWDVYMTTDQVYGPATTFEKLNSSPLTFNTNATSTNLQQIIVKGGGYLDAVAASLGHTNCDATSTDVLAQERTANANTAGGIPPYDYPYPLCRLDNKLGLDLMNGLEEGDKLKVFYTNSVWNEYTLEAGTWATTIGVDITNLSVTAGMGLRFDRGAGTNTVAFYPYNAEPSSANRTLYGTNQLNMRGWNLLAWPYARRAANSSPKNWGLDTGTAQAGDLIFIHNGNKLAMLSWDASTHKWKRGSQNATNTLSQGQAFWYYRKANNTIQWDVVSQK